ncbi:MAG: DNA-binding protein WhiA, partial [Firmicutes bacterium]|nr:DNA-binding protein WhiA [Bacillota bacterium]
MSFSSKVKEELAGHVSKARHCRMAELAAILGGCARIRLNPPSIEVQSESSAVVKKVFTLLQKTFNINAKVSVRRSAFLQKNGIYTIVVTNREDVRRILDATRMIPLEEPGQWIPGGVILQKDCCRRNFLRGAYLASGSMSNPEKGYHFEIACTMRQKAEQLREVLASFGVEAKIILRKKY